MAKIKVYCRIYNAKPFLEQCIASVLAQTYPDFEFYAIDNGCTDGSSEIIDAFAAADPRIRVIRFEKNTHVANSLYNIIRETAEGYITILDSDDWWEPDYLENMLNFAERYDLDIACTGTCMESQETGARATRDLDQPLFLKRWEFATFFPVYHVFFRTYWGKLFRAEVLAQENFIRFVSYGGDTLYAFEALQHSKQAGINCGALYHYRVRSDSISYKYSPWRFSADVDLYNDALRFLKGFGPLSEENRRFLKEVFGNAVLDSVRVLSQAEMTPKEKASEFRKIAEHPFTKDVYQNEKRTAQSHDEVVFHALKIAQSLDRKDFADMGAAIRALLPNCGECVTGEMFPLFCAEPPLMEALFKDDRDLLVGRLLSLIQDGRYVRQYDLGSMVRVLAKNRSLLGNMDDAAFMAEYPAIYQALWQGRTVEALDEMTGLLLEDRVQSAKETFLQLYLGAAAQLEEVPCFIFGKIQMAKFYFQQDRREECRMAVKELEEMGIEEDQEIDFLRKRLDEEPYTL